MRHPLLQMQVSIIMGEEIVTNMAKQLLGALQIDKRPRHARSDVRQDGIHR